MYIQYLGLFILFNYFKYIFGITNDIIFEMKFYALSLLKYRKYYIGIKNFTIYNN